MLPQGTDPSFVYEPKNSGRGKLSVDDCTYGMEFSANNRMQIDNRSEHRVCMHAMLDFIGRATTSCGYMAKQKQKQVSREQNRNRQQHSITQTGSSRSNEPRRDRWVKTHTCESDCCLPWNRGQPPGFWNAQVFMNGDDRHSSKIDKSMMRAIFVQTKQMCACILPLWNGD